MNVPSTRAARAVAAMGLCAGRDGGVDADYETLEIAKALVPSAFRGYVPARHPALHYGLALNDHGYFWKFAGGAGSAVGRSAARRSRAHFAAGLHPCRQCKSAAAHAEKTHSAARLFGEALTEMRALTSRKAAPAGDGFVESFPVPALTALLQAKLGRPQLTKADWIGLGAIVRS